MRNASERRPERLRQLWSMLGVLLFIGGGPLFAAEVSSYRVQRYTANDGLSVESLMHVSLLRDGRVLVVGVNGEPLLFDGHRFTVLPFDHAGPTVFDGAYSSLQAANGDYWISSYGTGLHQIHAGRLITHALPDDAKPLYISLTQDGESLLLPTNKGLFIARLRGETLQAERFDPPLPLVTAIQSPDGTIYAGGGNGLFRAHGRTLRQLEPRLTNVHIWSLKIDRRGRLLIGTRGMGLVILDADGFRQVSTAEGLPNSVVRAVAEVDDDLWLATAGGGIARLHGEQIEVINSASGLSSDTVTWIEADRSGVLWAATAGAGLNRLWPSPFTNYADAVGRRGGFHFALHRDPEGQVWVGSNQGLARLSNGVMQSSSAPASGQGSTVLSIIDDPDGGLLLGTRRGIYRYHEPEGFSALGGTQDLVKPILWQHSAHGVLIAAANQIWRWQDRKLLPVAALPVTASVLNFAHDPEFGLLIAGTDGAYGFDGQHLQRLPGPSEPVSDFLRLGESLLIAGEQLGVIEGSGFRKLDLLPDESASTIIRNIWRDRLGGIWMTTRNGLLRLDQRALEKGGTGQVGLRRFGLSDGLSSVDFEGGPQAMLSNPDGSFLIAGTGGSTRVDPVLAAGEAQSTAVQLRLGLNGLEDEQRSYPPAPGIVLPAGTRRVGLSFTALPASHSAMATLRYRLLPVESAFRSDLGQRAAVYGGLRPGRYRLELEGEIPGAGAPTERFDYSFQIAPRLIERVSVQIAIGVALLALLALIPTLHIRSLRNQRRRLIDAVADRTAELERQARTDSLTGLLNRRSFDQLLDQALGSAAGCGLILIDIDHFKRYNDSLGHQAGDHCLKQVALTLEQTVQSQAPNHQAYVARIGGEEFAVILGHGDADRLSDLAEALRAAIVALNLPHPASPEQIVTLSLGMAVAQPGEMPDYLARRADQALYHAKDNGRNRCESR